MLKIKFAVIGRNFVVDWFIKSALQFDELEFYAVYSRKEETGIEFARKYNVNVVYTDINALCDDENIDFVYIASPNAFHKIQAVKLLKAKKHVLCEKPAVIDSFEFDEVMKTAKKSGCIFMEAMVPVHSPAIKGIKEDLYKIGKIRHATFVFCQYSSRYDKFKNKIVENAFIPSLGNGALMDIGIYPISFMEYLFGMPEKIFSQSVFIKNSIDSNGAVIMQYEDMIGEIIYSKVSDSCMKSEIQGEAGSIIIDKMSRPVRYSILMRDGTSFQTDTSSHKEDMYYEIQDFINQIKHKDCEDYNRHTSDVLKIIDEIRSISQINFED